MHACAGFPTCKLPPHVKAPALSVGCRRGRGLGRKIEAIQVQVGALNVSVRIEALAGRAEAAQLG